MNEKVKIQIQKILRAHFATPLRTHVRQGTKLIPFPFSNSISPSMVLSSGPPSKTERTMIGHLGARNIRLHKRLWLSCNRHSFTEGMQWQQFEHSIPTQQQPLLSSCQCQPLRAFSPTSVDASASSEPGIGVLSFNMDNMDTEHISSVWSIKIPFQQRSSRHPALRIWWSSSWQHCDKIDSVTM